MNHAEQIAYQQKPGYDRPNNDVPSLQPFGEIYPGPDLPLGFFLGNDGNLWSWSARDTKYPVVPPTRYWKNEGHPPGVQISRAMGTLLIDGWRPYLFVSGSDGCLWTRWWQGEAWYWTNLGRPGGAEPVEPMGCELIGGGEPLIFMKASDDSLWLCRWQDPNWQWNNLGRPPTAYIDSAMTTAIIGPHDRAYVWMMGSDGNIWCCYWMDGYHWVAHAPPFPGARPRCCNVSNGTNDYIDFYSYVGNDQWRLIWSREQWRWTRDGRNWV